MKKKHIQDWSELNKRIIRSVKDDLRPIVKHIRGLLDRARVKKTEES